MPRLADLPLRLRTALRLYPWRRLRDRTWQALPRPLPDCRIALCSTAGLVLPDQPAFDARRRGGDASLRWIPREAVTARLRDTHRSTSYDHAGIAQDANLAFPLDRLRELARSGVIGTLAPRHLSFMGSITAPGRLVRRTGPEAAAGLVTDGVDAVLLVPV